MLFKILFKHGNKLLSPSFTCTEWVVNVEQKVGGRPVLREYGFHCCASLNTLLSESRFSEPPEVIKNLLDGRYVLANVHGSGKWVGDNLSHMAWQAMRVTHFGNMKEYLNSDKYEALQLLNKRCAVTKATVLLAFENPNYVTRLFRSHKKKGV